MSLKKWIEALKSADLNKVESLKLIDILEESTRAKDYDIETAEKAKIVGAMLFHIIDIYGCILLASIMREAMRYVLESESFRNIESGENILSKDTIHVINDIQLAFLGAEIIYSDSNSDAKRVFADFYLQE